MSKSDTSTFGTPPSAEGGMEYTGVQIGSRVQVTSYGPFRGLRGTIRTVDTIAVDLDESHCFFQIVLDGAYMQEPIWFESDEVE